MARNSIFNLNKASPATCWLLKEDLSIQRELQKPDWRLVLGRVGTIQMIQVHSWQEPPRRCQELLTQKVRPPQFTLPSLSAWSPFLSASPLLCSNITKAMWSFPPTVGNPSLSWKMGKSFIFVFVFDTGSCYVNLDSLELTTQARLASDSVICQSCLESAGIKGTHNCAQLIKIL